MSSQKLSQLNLLPSLNPTTLLYVVPTGLTSNRTQLSNIDFYITGGRPWSSGAFNQIYDLSGRLRIDLNSGNSYIYDSGNIRFLANSNITAINDTIGNRVLESNLNSNYIQLYDPSQAIRFLADSTSTELIDELGHIRFYADNFSVQLLDIVGNARFNTDSSQTYMADNNGAVRILVNNTQSILKSPNSNLILLGTTAYTNLYTDNTKVRISASGEQLKLIDISGNSRFLSNNTGTRIYDNLGTIRADWQDTSTSFNNKSGGNILLSNSSNTTLKHTTGSTDSQSRLILGNNSIQMIDINNIIRYSFGANTTFIGDSVGNILISNSTQRGLYDSLSNLRILIQNPNFYIYNPDGTERLRFDNTSSYINDIYGHNRLTISTGAIILSDVTGISRFYADNNNTYISDKNNINRFLANNTQTIINDSSNNIVFFSDSNSTVLTYGGIDRFYADASSIVLQLDGNNRLLIDLDNTNIQDNNGNSLINLSNGEIYISDAHSNYVFRHIQNKDTIISSSGNDYISILPDIGRIVNNFYPGQTWQICDYGDSAVISIDTGITFIGNSNLLTNIGINAGLYIESLQSRITDQSGLSIFTAKSGYAIFNSGIKPTSSTFAGIPGMFTFDAGFFYCCTGINRWGRATLAPF